MFLQKDVWWAGGHGLDLRLKIILVCQSSANGAEERMIRAIGFLRCTVLINARQKINAIQLIEEHEEHDQQARHYNPGNQKKIEAGPEGSDVGTRIHRDFAVDDRAGSRPSHLPRFVP